MALNQLGIIAAPPLLGLVHDLTGGYAALWACVVVAALAGGLCGDASFNFDTITAPILLR
jgi:cyanate permease